jgi:acetylornithine deacetylase
MSAERVSSVEMIRRLVAFDTVSARSNLALIDAVRVYLAGHGIAARVVHDAAKTKANLFATIGPGEEGGIALSGHTDVVPVEGQAWSSDPFTVSARDKRLYGRGTADMKSFIAIALAMVPELQTRKLKKPIHLCLSYDEEIGCLGVPGLLALMGRELPKPTLAIIGEPTMMRVVNAHKGVSVFRTTISGREGHSSAPQRGANAVAFMARFMTHLEEVAAELRETGARQAVPGLDFDPPYSSMNLGIIRGGTAINIIARDCELMWEIRSLPGENVDAILARIDKHATEILLPALRETAPDASIATQTIVAVPGLKPEPGGAAEELALRLTGANRTFTAAFASEAGQFQGAGISAVLCGPGDIAQAHQPDEFIALEQIAACETFLRKMADWAAQ